MKKLTLVILGILIFQSSFSQTQNLPGYIVTLKGDTIHGTIDYHSWGVNPTKVSFRSVNDNVQNIYKPKDIKSFSVNHEIYVSAKVKVEVGSRNINNLHQDPVVKTKLDMVFLETMIRGVKSLYHFKNSDGIEDFYIKHNGEYVLLIYKKYLKKLRDDKRFVQNIRIYITDNNKYLGQLAYYLKDCKSIDSKIKGTKYNQKSLEKLFLYYYDCTHSEVEFKKNIQGLKLEVGVLAGISSSSIEFNSTTLMNIVNAKDSRSLNFSGGMFLDLVLPRTKRKLSIYNELIYTSFKFENYYSDYTNENKYTNTHVNFGYSYLKMNNMLRFKYPIGRLYVFANAGISNGVVISEINKEQVESKFYATTRSEVGKVINDTRKYELGYLVGLGAKYNKYSFEMRYEKGINMFPYTTLGSTTIRYYVLFGYRF